MCTFFLNFLPWPHDRDTQQPFSYLTLHVAGIVYLRRGQVLTLGVLSYSDTNWRLYARTSFYAARLSTSALPSLQGFSVEKGNNQVISKATGWFEVTGWRSDSSQLFDLNQGFTLTSGRYTAPVAGIYICAANIRLDKVNSPYVRQVIVVNGGGTTINDEYSNGA